MRWTPCTSPGSTPTTSSSVYSGAIALDSEGTTTIKAIASKTGLTDSEVATAAYTIKESISGYNIDFESDLSDYVNWEFTNINTDKTAITAHAGNQYGVTAGTQTASIQTKEKVANPDVLTCFISKTSGNTTSSSWTFSVSTDGDSWSEVATRSASDMSKGEWKELTANLSTYTDVYVLTAEVLLFVLSMTLH